MNIDADVINRIGSQLMLRAAQALKKEEFSQEEFSSVCSFLLDNLERCKTQEDIISFLTGLSDKWPLFSDYLAVERGKIVEKQEDVTVKRVEDLIHNNKLDEALKVAEGGATNNQ